MENRIKEVLKNKGISVGSLAEKVGITQPNMSNIINGKSNPSIETLEKIANVLEVSISELLETKTELYGVVLWKNKAYRIDNEMALKQLYNDYFAEKQ